MTTPIADGTYQISNILSPDTCLDLIEGLPYAALNAWKIWASPNLRWIVKNVGDNKISLENVTARGYYAGITYYSKAAAVFGSPSPTYWTVKQVSEDVYTIEAADGLQLSQRLDGPGASVYLGPIYTNDPAGQAQWKFKSIE